MANARASTGPKTAQGRVRSAQNALRHGLNVPVYSDPLLSEELDALAREIAGRDANPEIHELARRVAETQINLRRIRSMRHQLVNDALRDPDYESEARKRKQFALVRRWARVHGPLTPMPYEVLEFLYSKPDGPDKLAMILSDKARQLRALDRYERRAFSRSKFATRGLDEARGIRLEKQGP